LKTAFAAEPKNADTAGRIGEILRLQSWDGAEDYPDKAKAAMDWFARAAKLNPFDAYHPMRQGMCLVWLGQAAAATPYFERAGQLDPNSYYTVAHLGWHQFHLGDYARARAYFDRSLKLTPYGTPNPLARSYLDLMERRLKEPPSLLKPR
jgi:tetratricopeptide (TPR) repeat protein